MVERENKRKKETHMKPIVDDILKAKKQAERRNPKDAPAHPKHPKCISITELEERVIRTMSSLWKCTDTTAILNCVLEKWEKLVEKEPTLKYAIYSKPRDKELAELLDEIKDLGLTDKLEQYKKIFPKATTSELIGAAKGIIAEKEIADKLDK